MDENSPFWVGQVTFVILVAPVLAAIASLILIGRYQAVTAKGMRMMGGARQQPPKPPVSEREPPAPLQVRFHDGKNLAPTSQRTEAAFQEMDRALRGSVATYLAGGFAYALVMALATSQTAGDGFRFWRFLVLLTGYMWPAALAASLVSGNRGGSLGIYAAGLLAVAFGTVAASSQSTLGSIWFTWILLNGPGTVFVLLFLHRKLRAMGPLLLVFFTAGVTGAVLAFEILRRSGDSGLGTVAQMAHLLGLSASAALWLVLLAGSAILAVFGRLAWNLLGRRYVAKQFSNQMLILDCLWLQFALIQPLTILQSGWWMLAGLVGFAAYKLVTRSGFALLKTRFPAQTPPPTLLLLRVFALGHKSERFFKAFGRWWLRWGSIRLIAGPDLAVATVSPDDFLGFVAGRHLERFVKSDQDLEARSLSIDNRSDPDGVYRVNGFFCHADTWQRTMCSLAKNSQAVLMDLRSFAPANRGCTYELEQLLDFVDLERVALVVDDSTDRDFLTRTLRELWMKLLPESPNRRLAEPVIHVFHASRPDRATIRALLLVLGEPHKMTETSSHN